jgi:hypothetical protein
MATVELKNDTLWFEFPEVHEDAKLGIDLQRTLRIPDDGKKYSLPPGLGSFPMCRVDEYKANAPASWIEHGGIMIPMYQSEAMWIRFQPSHTYDRDSAYPFAIKISTGKVSAVTGETYQKGLKKGDYLVAPLQPWLDGYVVEKGLIRQFVATPLGSGFSAEAQITGQDIHGGIQVEVIPMKKENFERRFPKRKPVLYSTCDSIEYERGFGPSAAAASIDMSLAPGGMMKQEIYEDPYGLEEWARGYTARCFIHIANSLVWSAITGKQPPTTPPTAKQYTNAGLPWFEYYNDALKHVNATDKLKGLKGVAEMGKEKKMPMLPENEPVSGEKVVVLKGKPNEVRQGTW